MIKFRDLVFQRLFAITALIASISIFVEIKGLFLSNGISPFSIINTKLNQLNFFWKIPSIFIFNASDRFIYFICFFMIASLLLLLANNYKNNIVKSYLFLCFYLGYLSFVNFGEPFMSFQWDALLLETSFLFAIYFFLSQDDELSKINIWLFRILVFKLMLMSGLVKISSRDWSWLDCTALNYHYFTQPLPNPLSFFVHQLPKWFHQFSCMLMFVIELLIPFFIFFGKRLREFAAWTFIILQVLIFITGNYGFFNLLTIVLCFSLFDFDSSKEFTYNRLSKNLSIGTLVIYSLISFSLILTRLKVPAFFVKPAQLYFQFLGPFHLCNSYGLFAVMTKSRAEIVIQGGKRIPGELGIEWKEYKFKYKPGDLKSLPRQIAPFQPRLDWQMWFAALGNYQQNPWFVNLVRKLLENEKDVTYLFAVNPFKDSKPDFVRALAFEYEFNKFDEYIKTGEIWKRIYKGVYLPEVSLK